MSIQEYLRERRKLVETALMRCLPQVDPCVQRLGTAMRYCVFPGGKRLRPILAIAAAEAVGGSIEGALLPAIALEFIHTSSLIYDDLPCMDGSDFRRGKPACYRVFGEAVALLAGHCLFARGLVLCCHGDLARRIGSHQLSRLLTEIDCTVGPMGLAGGQFLDLCTDDGNCDLGAIRRIQARKTGALIRLALVLGGLTVPAPDSALKCLSGYGECIGLAFQIRDDLIDTQRALRDQEKVTFRRSRKAVRERPRSQAHLEQEIRELTTKAKMTLEPLGSGTRMLGLLADYLAKRKT